MKIKGPDAPALDTRSQDRWKWSKGSERSQAMLIVSNPDEQVLYILRGKPGNAGPHCEKQVLLEAVFDLKLDAERVSWLINQSYDSDSHSQ